MVVVDPGLGICYGEKPLHIQWYYCHFRGNFGCSVGWMTQPSYVDHRLMVISTCSIWSWSSRNRHNTDRLVFQLSKLFYRPSCSIHVARRHPHARTHARQEANAQASKVGPETISFIRALAWGRYLSRGQNGHRKRKGEGCSRQVSNQAEPKRVSRRIGKEGEKQSPVQAGPSKPCF